jgi:hypothetical protein
MSRFLWEFMSRVDRLDRQQWLIVLAVTALVGFLCMRGYGSRNTY